MKVIGITGWSGAGKTTLLKRLIPALTARGLKVSTVKHAHHHFDVDIPGKDSHTHRAAGATEVLVSSSKRFALMHELREEEEFRLADLLKLLNPVDLVLIEGFKTERHPKIEVHRLANEKPFLFPADPTIMAVVTDDPNLQATIPVLRFEDIEPVAESALANAQPLASVLERLDGVRI